MAISRSDSNIETGGERFCEMWGEVPEITGRSPSHLPDGAVSGWIELAWKLISCTFVRLVPILRKIRNGCFARRAGGPGTGSSEEDESHQGVDRAEAEE